jgi:hypothetical protein
VQFVSFMYNFLSMHVSIPNSKSVFAVLIALKEKKYCDNLSSHSRVDESSVLVGC